MRHYFGIFFLFVSSVFGVSFTHSKYGLEFLRSGVGARAEGMGNAYTAVAEDVTAVYWNPAGLVRLKSIELHGMHAERFLGVVNYDFFGFGMRFGETRAMGLGIVRLGVDNIPITNIRNPDRELGELYTDSQGKLVLNRPYVAKYVSDQEWAFLFSYGVQKTEKWAWGCNLKTLFKAMGDSSAWGLGLDLGVQWNPVYRLRTALTLRDVTTTLLAWNRGQKEWIAPRVTWGFAYPIAFRKFSFLPALDWGWDLNGMGKVSKWHWGIMDFELLGGLEVSYLDRIAFRIGSGHGRWNIGTGFRVSFFRFDYSYSSHPDLGNSHHISTVLQWDKMAAFLHK